LLLFVLGFILYGQTLKAPFFFDDNKMIVNNWALRDLGHIHEIWRVVDYPRLCFLTFVTFALNYHFGAYDVVGYHLINVLLHISNAFLLYLFVLGLLRFWKEAPTRLSDQKIFIGLAASAIYLSHPIQTQSVSLIWSRTELLSAFFGFLSLVLYIKGRIKKKLLYFLLSVVCFVGGIFCRGNMLILPILVLAMEVCFGGLSLGRIRSGLIRFWYLWLAGFCFLLFLWLRFTAMVVELLRLEAVMPESWLMVKIYLLTQFHVVCRYIQLLLLPINQNIDHFVVSSESLFDGPAFFSLVIILGVLALAFFLYRNKRLLAFGIIWFFVGLLPVSTIFVLSTLMSESRLYFPAAGFAIFISGFLALSTMPLRARRYTAVVVIILLGFLTINRNMLWKSPIKLMEASVRQSPEYFRPHLVLGTLYAQEGRVEEAENMFRRAIYLRPDYLPPYNNLAIMHILRGDINTAMGMYKKIIKIDPTFLQAYLNLGYIYIQLGDWWKAKDVFIRSIAKCGPSPDIYVGLADSYMARGRLEDSILNKAAEENLKKALALDPGHTEALFRLGQVYSMRHAFEDAGRIFKQLLRIKPENINAMVELARAYMAQNEFTQAERILLNAAELAPRHIQVHEMLAHVYFTMKDFNKAEEFYHKANQLFAQKKAALK